MSTPQPTEFRYWDRLERPWARAARAVGKRVLGFDLAPADEVVRAFAAAYYDADPLAEAVVDELYLGGEPARGRAMFEQALTAGVAAVPAAPASLAALWLGQAWGRIGERRLAQPQRGHEPRRVRRLALEQRAQLG